MRLKPTCYLAQIPYPDKFHFPPLPIKKKKKKLFWISLKRIRLPFCLQCNTEVSALQLFPGLWNNRR